MYCSLPSVCTTSGICVLFNGVIIPKHSVHVEDLGANSWCLTEYWRLALANSEAISYYNKYLLQTGCVNIGVLYCYKSCTIWKAQGPSILHTLLQSWNTERTAFLKVKWSVAGIPKITRTCCSLSHDFLSVDALSGSTAQNETTCSQMSTSPRSFFRHLTRKMSNRSRTGSTKYVVPHLGHCVQEIRPHHVTFLIYSDHIVWRG